MYQHLETLPNIFEIEIPNDDLKKNVNEKEISKIVELRFEDVIDQVLIQVKSIGKSVTDFKSGIKISIDVKGDLFRIALIHFKN